MAMSLTVDVSEPVRSLDAMSHDLPAVFERVNAEMAAVVTREAQTRHQFRSQTGRLVESVTPQASSKELNVYLDTHIADYGPMVHEGTKKMKGDPFLLRAFERNENKIVDGMDRAISAEIERVGLA